MAIRAEEVGEILKSKIRKFERVLESKETGSVVSASDGIARIYGLEAAEAGELIEFPGGVKGLVLNLESSDVGAAILGSYENIREGDTVKRTGEIASVPVGEALLGRVVDPLGNPIDGKGPIKTEHRLPIERKAPGIVPRQSVK